MAYVDFMSGLHGETDRDYLERVIRQDKAECAAVAKQFGYDYWDGDRVLDVGCGKAYLLYEMKRLLPGLSVTGIDKSEYAIEHTKEEIKGSLLAGEAVELPFEDSSFDLVFSLAVLHNLYLYDLKRAVGEIRRVSRKNSYIMVESYRNEREKMNLLYWQLTCECFFNVEEWEWLYCQWGYEGDYSFIFFE